MAFPPQTDYQCPDSGLLCPHARTCGHPHQRHIAAALLRSDERDLPMRAFAPLCPFHDWIRDERGHPIAAPLAAAADGQPLVSTEQLDANPAG